MVLQEDQRCNNNNSNSGGRGGGGGGNSRSCKKAKQDKIPQRGLGVAELERILQDQQRNSGSSAITLPSSSGLILPPPLPLPRLPHPSSAAIATDLSSSSFRTGTTATASNFFGQSSTAMSLSSLPLPVIPDSYGLHGRPMGIAGGGHTTNFGPPYSLPNDTLPDPIWWCPPQSQRIPQQQQQQSTTKSTSSSLLPSSSGVNIQMEPPSNQIPFSSTYTLPPSPWAEDERACIKRPWPFPFENTITPGPCKIPNSFTKPEYELPLPLPLPVYGADAFRPEQRNTACRESSAASGSGSYQVDYRSMSSNYHQRRSLVDMGNIKDSGLLPPDHLHPLIPPTPFPLNFKYKQPISFPSANYLETPEFNLPPSSFPISRRAETEIPSATSLQRPFYEFLPTEPICTGTSSNKEGEEEDSIDLRLKL